MTVNRMLKQAALATAAAIGASAVLAAPTPAAAQERTKPTIILVHGAFADGSSWAAVVPGLVPAGYRVVAAANPLRSLKGDAGYVSDLVTSLKEPVVLVGHSYGGSVITDAAVGHANEKALVYVAGVAPDAGESTFDLVGKFPGSTLGAALEPPVNWSNDAHDLYVQAEKFSAPLAADLPAARTQLLAAAQRPVTDVALKELSGTPAWKTIPSWFVYGSADMSIPAASHHFMAERAKARDTVAVNGASHLVMLSHPEAVEHVIEEAAAAAAK